MHPAEQVGKSVPITGGRLLVNVIRQRKDWHLRAPKLFDSLGGDEQPYRYNHEHAERPLQAWMFANFHTYLAVSTG